MSFKEETTFLMTSVKSFKELETENVIKLEKPFDLLKSAAIYGQNGSGKSNFILAISVMTWIINNSFSESLKSEEEKVSHHFKFRLNSQSEHASTLFEVSFLVNDIIFRYGFEVLDQEIVKEWLYSKVERENLLFERNKQVFKINKTNFKEGIKYKSDVNSNVLFLSHLSQNNQPISKSIWYWFKDINEVSGIDDSFYNKVSAKLLEKDPNFKKWISYALKYLEITSIETSESEGEIYTYHNKYDENNLLIGSEPFHIIEESEGTKKLIHILGPIYDTLRHGKRLFLDEFDSKLHPNLSKKLIKLFNEYNTRGAQFILSAQDPTLLNKELFRRDQIWFAEKDQFGASSLYSLSDFNSTVVRADSAFDRKYLENKFGAAESMDITTGLKDLLYVEQK